MVSQMYKVRMHRQWFIQIIRCLNIIRVPGPDRAGSIWGGKLVVGPKFKGLTKFGALYWTTGARPFGQACPDAVLWAYFETHHSHGPSSLNFFLVGGSFLSLHLLMICLIVYDVVIFDSRNSRCPVMLSRRQGHQLGFGCL